MTNGKFARLFGEPVRKPDKDPLTQFHMDMAASIQAVTEEIVLRLTRSLAAEYGIPNLCMAGGVALNCVANGKILNDGAFQDLWIQPAAGDAGGAVGAALAAYHIELKQAFKFDYVAFYDKPFLKFERLLETYVALAPRGLKSFQMAMPLWLKEKLFQKHLLTKELSVHDGASADPCCLDPRIGCRPSHLHVILNYADFRSIGVLPR